MRTETLTSAQNPKIKTLLDLQEKSKARRGAGLFVVEGRRELLRCLRAGFSARALFLCGDLLPEAEAQEILSLSEQSNPGCCLFRIPHEVYRKAAYRENTEGIIAEIEYKELTFKDIHLSEKPLVVVLEAVEKPGNLGAVIRSAEAAGADAVLVCDPLTDLFNPNLIRASLGGVFTMQVVATSNEDALTWLKSRPIQILAAQLQDSEPYYETSMLGGTALVFGAESAGLTPFWREAADARIRIPMSGCLDSLNVSVSAAILLFEAVRQRQTAYRKKMPPHP